MSVAVEPLTLAKGNFDSKTSKVELDFFFFSFLFLTFSSQYFFFSKSDVRRAIELLEKLQLSGEVPATKLAALQKVLQSDFLSAVREVYER